jgi:hypothetical protein
MKTKFYLAGGVFAASLAFCMPLNAQLTPATTASPAATVSPAAKWAARPLPFQGKVSAVDQTAKTFTISGKQGTRTFKITDGTVITKTGAPATMTDLVANERVRGAYIKLPDGTLEAKTVTIGPKTEGEKKAKKSKKGAAEEEASPAVSPTP